MHSPSFIQLAVGALAASSAMIGFQPTGDYSALSTRYVVSIMSLVGSAWGAPTRENTALEARKPRLPGGRRPDISPQTNKRNGAPLYGPRSIRHDLGVHTPRGPGNAGAAGGAQNGAQARGANAIVNTGVNSVGNLNPPTNRNRPAPNRPRAEVYAPHGGLPPSSPLRRAEDAKGRYPHIVRHV